MPTIQSIRSFSHTKIPRPKGFHSLTVDPDIPLDLEIGSGAGLHAIQYAQQNPDRHLIAIEKTTAKFNRLKRRLDHHPDINNLTIIHGDAIAWMTHGFKPKSLARIFILYPNPEPKNPAKRWVRTPFMEKILELLQDKGTLQLATNVESYWQEAEFYLVNYWQMELLHSRPLPPDHPPRTHFEKKYLARGESCYDILVKKKGPHFNKI